MTQPEWPARLTAITAERIKTYRQMRGMSAQQLADVCKRIGYEVPRSVIANIESGRRPWLSVAELLTIAQALGVSPVLLIIPLESGRVFEVRPDEYAAGWSAAQWFTGRSHVQYATDESTHVEPVYIDPVRINEEHDAAWDSLHRARARTAKWRYRSKTQNGDVAASLELAIEQEQAAEETPPSRSRPRE